MFVTSCKLYILVLRLQSSMHKSTVSANALNFGKVVTVTFFYRPVTKLKEFCDDSLRDQYSMCVVNILTMIALHICTHTGV